MRSEMVHQELRQNICLILFNNALKRYCRIFHQNAVNLRVGDPLQAHDRQGVRLEVVVAVPPKGAQAELLADVEGHQ